MKILKYLMIQYQNRKLLYNSILCIILLYLFIFNFIGMNQIAFNHNMITGKVECDTLPGFRISAPWIQVSNIDKRPIRVCIDCSCRNINCKLVSFNVKGYKEFIQKEGWSYFWLRNRFSFNMGNKEEWRGFNNVIRGYAFDEKKYTFINYY